jgi:ComF family protein
MIFSLKQGTHPELGRFLGRAAADEVMKLFHPDLVTFVPVSAKRKRERGYNQAEIIARSLGRSIKKPVRDSLRVRESGNQKSMHYNERFLNMIGRFCGEGDSCLGRSVLLVDDVFTTGATVNECARILKKMGASSVFSLTIARVDNKKVAVAASVGYNFRQ